MQCEMCGDDFPRLKPVRVEGTLMQLCNRCARFGEEVAPPAPKASPTAPATIQDRLAARQRKATPRDVLDTMAEELLEGFGAKIRTAREKKGWTREQLADRIHQPVPTVTKYEAEQLHPGDETVRLIERELGIKLLEAVPRSQIPAQKKVGDRAVTLGDLIKQAKKKGD